MLKVITDVVIVGSAMDTYFWVCSVVIGLTVIGAIFGFVGLAGPVFGWGGKLVDIGVTMTMLSPVVWIAYLMIVAIRSAL